MARLPIFKKMFDDDFRLYFN